jgi:hypothetical protein
MTTSKSQQGGRIRSDHMFQYQPRIDHGQKDSMKYRNSTADTGYDFLIFHGWQDALEQDQNVAYHSTGFVPGCSHCLSDLGI